jgi:hypothetical protein
VSNPFIQIPRSLLQDPLWVKLSPKCQIVFIQILSHVCYLPQKFNDHGNIIDLKPGQICTTIREILKWCGDDFSKTEIERCIKKLILCGFCGQEVRHVKSVISITHSDTYELLIQYSETRNETKLRQDRDKIETEKDKEDKDISNDISKKENALRDEAHPASPIRSKDSLTFNFDKWEFEGISEKDIANWKLMYSHIDIQVETLKAAQWLKNNPSKAGKKNWRKYLTGWYGRSNDSLENKKAYRSAAAGTSQDRRTKDIHGNPIKSRAEGLF